MKNASGVTYLHGDHLGSTSATSGAQPGPQTYYPYGGVRNGSLPTDYMFTGQIAVLDLDQRYLAGIPNGTIVSGALRTNPPQPIIAAVSFATASTTYGDACMFYEGIPQ
ncbi:MAG: hypothetical protein HY868_22345 [Chloroflexi bacterium]|nr:hypothetical protein [Chloroflexota bacterium]